MYGTVRDFFISTEIQSHLCHIIGQSLKTAFIAAKENKNFYSHDYEKIDYKIENLEKSDIIDLSKVFLERFDYKSEHGIGRKGNIVSIMRSVKSDSAPLREKNNTVTENKLISFYKQISELAPIVRLIREQRNYFAHPTTHVRNELGWNTSVLVLIIRACEISSVPKKSYDLNIKIITKCEDLLNQTLAGNKTTEVGQKQSVEIGFTEPKLIESINEINNQLMEIKNNFFDAFNDLKTSKKMPAKIQKTHPEDDDFEDPEFENDKDDKPFEQNITPEVLRAELRLLNRKIGSYFEKDELFSPSLNLVAISNIGEILENEPENLDKFVTLENVRFNFEDHQGTYKKQIEEFGEKIDELLKKVLWPQRF